MSYRQKTNLIKLIFADTSMLDFYKNQCDMFVNIRKYDLPSKK